MQLIKKIYNRLTNKYYLANLKYLKYYKNCPINDNMVLLESQQGIGVNGNIFYILKELTSNSKYNHFEIYLSIRNSLIPKIKEFLKFNNIHNVNVISLSSKEYYKTIASAKYLVNDNTFLPFFIKKEGQVYLNTWHGTPLKTLGKHEQETFHNIGNPQKNFVVADYLLFPNEYTFKHIVDDYMVRNLSNAKILLDGYPRNTAFFDKKRANQIKEELSIDENKKIYMYMPTWRGQVGKIDNSANVYLQYYLYEIDKNLKENEVMYVNLHPIARKNINFKQFKNIHAFPSQYETYEFLNIADCLITDYSSVFFDFAITRKKIILFTYDKDEYLSKRGTYFDMNKLPFPQVNDVKSLLKELRGNIKYNDSKFLQTFCSYDSKNATKELCERIFLNNKNKVVEKDINGNNKNNILIYVGNLAKNGVTSSIRNLLNLIDVDKNNYYLTFSANLVNANKEALRQFPEGVYYYSIKGKTNVTLFQKIILKLYDKKLIPFKLYYAVMKPAYKYEIKRNYGDIKFSDVIQFNGYEYRKLLLLSNFNCNRIVFVHSDMVEEIRIRKNQRKSILKYCYKSYDKVAIVTDGLIESTKYFTKGKTDNFVIVNNAIDYKGILEKSRMSIDSEDIDELNVDFERLEEVLENKNFKKFINIGRYTAEKGHERLINSFYKIWKEHKNVYLIIMGGLGKNYQKIKDLVESLECKNEIILLRGVANPYPILKRCDYFVLSSFYEGFGIVITEADILNVPVISTNISGPRKFMEDNNGTLVENSANGIYHGMKLLLEEKVKTMNVDYEKYNNNIVNQFESLLNNSQKE